MFFRCEVNCPNISSHKRFPMGSWGKSDEQSGTHSRCESCRSESHLAVFFNVIQIDLNEFDAMNCFPPPFDMILLEVNAEMSQLIDLFRPFVFQVNCIIALFS